MAWQMPNDVGGWCTQLEAELLAKRSEGKIVLEMGSRFGRSTIAMAQGAGLVHSVDWHKGDNWVGNIDSYEPMVANLKRYRVRDKVVMHVCSTAQFAAVAGTQRFDMVYVDAGHDFESARHDIAVAMAVVKRGGCICIHDWNWQSVKKAANSLGFDVPDEVADNLVVFTSK